ncbi:MAG: hypothetical protein ACO1OC_07500 [Tuberibacillus sp.]
MLELHIGTLIFQMVTFLVVLGVIILLIVFTVRMPSLIEQSGGWKINFKPF